MMPDSRLHAAPSSEVSSKVSTKDLGLWIQKQDLTTLELVVLPALDFALQKPAKDNTVVLPTSKCCNFGLLPLCGLTKTICQKR
jgi:hypothetical protein